MQLLVNSRDLCVVVVVVVVLPLSVALCSFECGHLLVKHSKFPEGMWRLMSDWAPAHWWKSGGELSTILLHVSYRLEYNVSQNYTTEDAYRWWINILHLKKLFWFIKNLHGQMSTIQTAWPDWKLGPVHFHLSPKVWTVLDLTSCV